MQGPLVAGDLTRRELDCITAFQSEFEKSFIFWRLGPSHRFFFTICNMRKLILTISSEYEGLQTYVGLGDSFSTVEVV